MSLLIKALDKAQAQKAQAKEGDNKKDDQPAQNSHPSVVQTAGEPDAGTNAADNLSLSPVDEPLTSKSSAKREIDDTPKVLKDSAVDAAQKEALRTSQSGQPTARVAAEQEQPRRAQAANVFAAKQTEPSTRTVKIAMVIGLLALTLLAGFTYWYQFVFNAPAIVVPPRPPVTQTMPQTETPTMTADATIDEAEPPATVKQAVVPEVNAAAPENAETTLKNSGQDSSIFNQASAQTEVAQATLTPDETIVTPAQAKVTLREAESAPKNASIEITRAKTESGINQVLMRAYEAYNLGNNEQAQTDYQLVLKRYGTNVDAMLGLGAIAIREARWADADNWYRQVLELEPGNAVAQSGLLSIQQVGGAQGEESQLKSMIAASPTDANLYAALGGRYASQKNWLAAQQAYFEAYRINPTADNAFNLAVSLDQLGQPNVALPYYQEALQKAGQSNLIDTAALKARISSIQ